jgi:N-acetyl-1-D-myo-inositol-2-amino-2-deoxy-alpha-D-glucopyranoside deacetylase
MVAKRAQAPRKRALVFVHAHPDDETVATGGTIARHVARGDDVTVVTCTRGDEGKIAVPELAHAAADRDDTLGDIRAGELAGALAALGVTDHRYLVAPGRYRDSGRLGRESNRRPDAFWQADLDEAASWLAGVIRERRADALVTYDPIGGYGHPDHIQTHRVTMRAAQLAETESLRVAGDPWRVPVIAWCAVPRDLIEAELLNLKAHEADHPYLWVDTDPGEYPDGVHPAVDIAIELDVTASYPAKRAALACHRTQLTVHGDYWVLASGRGMRIQDREWFIDARAWLAGERCATWRPELVGAP